MEKRNVTSFLIRKFKINFSRHFLLLIKFFEFLRIGYIFKNNNNIVLVYSIGKVGSSSIYNSIKFSKIIKYPVFHVHSLNPERINEQKKYYQNSKRKSIPHHLIQSYYIAKNLVDYKGTLHVFSLIREPISREISSIFQDSFNFTNSAFLNKNSIDLVVINKIQKLIKNLPENEWFERELNKVFGINIFNHDFDLKKGFFILKRDNLNFCLVRLENLDNSFNLIMKEMFNDNHKFKFILKNLASNKFYSGDYVDLKNNFKINNKDLSLILSNDFIIKFYSDYIKKIKVSWLKKI
tara:strand:- start:1180 stop:2061 length:882 start_codon:yes stop_codon:yes gene_type:complete